MPRVYVFTRWNNRVVESRRNVIDYLALDRCRQEVLSQEDVYEAAVRPFVNRCLQGCSGSIVTYGAWGSGKSYTLGTLERQQLATAAPDNETAGVLSRCTRQLYERLGPGAAVEVTCVEVQGDEVVDLLNSRAAPLSSSRLTAAAESTNGFNSTSSSSAIGCGSPGPPGHTNSPATGFSRSPIAAAAVSAYRRRPLSLVVALSLSEALATLERAVANRQAFVTSTRHSSSRTHAVFQLRWRNPSSPITGGGGAGGVTSVMARAAAPACSVAGGDGGGVSRAISAPPHSSVVMTPGAYQAETSAGEGPSGRGGPIFTLTLVDTCSFCPLLPPKEGNAVKRSLLALSRVLNALQRRHALSLRESKLTRMLEGAVDQVLLLACLGGAAGDEATMQLVKTLQQQGLPHESTVHRSRRVSASDSLHGSAAWESTQNLCPVSTVNPTSISRRRSQVGACTATAQGGRLRSCSNAMGSSQEKYTLSASRSSGGPALPLSPGYGAMYAARLAAAARTTSPRRSNGLSSLCGAAEAAEGGCVRPYSTSDRDATAGGKGSATAGGRASTCALSLAAAAAAAAASRSSSSKAARPLPLSLEASAADASLLRSPDGCGGSCGTSAGNRTPQSSGRLRAPSAIPTSPGVATASARAVRRLSPYSGSPWSKPASVTARASPVVEGRCSKGFSVLFGKWAQPPPVSARDVSFPAIPCVITSAQSGSGGQSSPHQSRLQALATTASSNDSSRSLTAAARLYGRGSGHSPSCLTAATGQSLKGGSGPMSTTVRILEAACNSTASSHDSSARPISPCALNTRRSAAPDSGMAIASSSPTGPGYTSSMSMASAIVTQVVTATAALMSPFSRPAAVTTACVVGTPDYVSSTAATPTSARRRSGIPARPLSRSPQNPSVPSPLAVATAHVPSPTASRVIPRVVPRSPPPAATSSGGAATLISLAGVPPTRLASMRYGSPNISHDSNVSAAAISALLSVSERPEVIPPGSRVQRSLLRKRSAATAANVLEGDADDEMQPWVQRVTSACKRSISSGLRWPSPLLRARRAEWLADMRRSRSALPRPVAEILEPLAGSAASPRQRPHGFRCAPLSRSTLSAQYKDLLQDFTEFKAVKRTPRHRCSGPGAGAPPLASSTDATCAPTARDQEREGNLAEGRLHVEEATTSRAASGLLSPEQTGRLHVSATAAASSSSTSRLGALALYCTAVATACSTPASNGQPPGSPGVSTPQSGRPASGGFLRPPPAFSRAHSPSADEMLLSLTAAAAAAASAAAGSPKTPVNSGTAPLSRPRLGVSRATRATASPRPLRSPERPATPVSPVTILDMSRLFASKGSPSAGAAAVGSGRSRLSAGSMTTVVAGGHLTSGGSDRYKRGTMEDRNSAGTSDSDSDLDCNRPHSGGSGLDICCGSESECENLLGPACLGNLGLMLDNRAPRLTSDRVLPRASIDQLVSSGRSSPASATARPAPLRENTAASVTAMAAAERSFQASGDESEDTDEELPAVSFFIHQFSPRASARRTLRAIARQRPQAEVSGAVSGAALGLETTASSSRHSAGLINGFGQQEGAAVQHQKKKSRSGPQIDMEQQHPPRRMRLSSGRASVTRLQQLSYAPQDRVSMESGVLRGSCNPSEIDDEARLQCGGPWEQSWEGGVCKLVQSDNPRAHWTVPSHSSVSLRQLLEQQQHLLQQQFQRPRWRVAGRVGAAAMAAAAVGWVNNVPTWAAQKATEEPPQVVPASSIWPPSPPLAANRLLAQRAHVRPNHVDLDEHSNVLMEADSASEADMSLLASPDSVRQQLHPVAAQRVSRPGGPGAGVTAAVRRDVLIASPTCPGLPFTEQPAAAMQAPSPVKVMSSQFSPQQHQQRMTYVTVIHSPASLAAPNHGREAPQGPAVESSPMAASETTFSSTKFRPAEGGASVGGRSCHQNVCAPSAVSVTLQGRYPDGASRPLLQAGSKLSSAVPMVTAEGTCAGAIAVMLGKQSTSTGSMPPALQLLSADSDPGACGSPQGSLGLYSAHATAVTVATTAGLPPPPRPPSAQMVRSLDGDTGTGCPHATLLNSPFMALSAQQQTQLPLRGSGNVAAAWRAAAAMATSSSSSVRSCFRSSSGQQQQQILPQQGQQQTQQQQPLPTQTQQQQDATMVVDATAVATVVGHNRAVIPCAGSDDKQMPAINTSCHSTGTAAVKRSNDLELLHQANSSTSTVASEITAAAAAATTTAPSLPPPSLPARTPFAAQSPPSGACMQEPHLPPHGTDGATVAITTVSLATAAAGSATASVPILPKAKSARTDRLFPLTSRLRGFISQRTPRPAVDVGAGAVIDAVTTESAEPQLPPPPAYPPGFVSWASKLFSGSRKSKPAG